MYAKTIGAAVVGAAAVLALTACGPSDGGPSTSTAPSTFSTVPSTIPADTSYAEQVMRDFWAAHDRCGNSGNSGLPIDAASCSRASEMMSTLPTPCISGYPDRPDEIRKCAEALRDSGKTGSPSATPATATAAPAPKPAALHDDPTATMSIADMVHAMSVRGVDLDKLDGRSATAMGELTMQDYRARNVACQASRNYLRDCASRDARRSSLPSRCVIEAERAPAAADAPALCGLALVYVEKVMGK